MRDKLIEDLKGFRTPICEGLNAKLPYAEELADYLLSSGVIKELTEENETLNLRVQTPLSPNNDIYIANLETQIKELTEENEKIGIENFDLICELSRIKADTVREMQERLKQMVLSNFPNLQGLPIFIDQIAEEMIGGNNVNKED